MDHQGDEADRACWLFRLTLSSTAKQREPIHIEIPVQRHDRRYCCQHQKFELYYDV